MNSTSQVAHKYMQAFKRGDIQAVEALLHPDVTLWDPFVGSVEGRSAILGIYREVFSENSIELNIGRELVSNDRNSVGLEFRISLVDLSSKKTDIKGIDIFRILDGRITDIVAYVHVT